MDKKRLGFVGFVKSIPVQAPCLLAGGLCILLGTACSLAPDTVQKSILGWVIVGIGALLGILWLVLCILRKAKDMLSIWLLWGMGACMRLQFILRMPYNLMQHDVRTFEDTEGHAGYILYYFREAQLPDFDVRTAWQYYHPPLHHMLCAGWMHLMSALGLENQPLYESMQVVPFLWSSAALMVFAVILRELGLKQRALTLPLAVMALHPSFIYLAGALNNDILSILLMLTALLYTVRWYHRPTWRYIIPLALSIGFGMMAKLSAWLAAPAAATVFLVMLWKNRRKPLPYIRQYGVFLLLCVPTALWWEIRNAILWDMPLTYIPMLSSSSKQYVGDHPVWERLFDFSPHQFRYIYDCFTIYGQDYSEYNPLVGLMKTAVFDEYIKPEHVAHITGFGEVLFWSQAVLAALVLVCMVTGFLHKGRTAWPLKTGMLLVYAATMVSYYSFCFTFAHTCTQSARYATPAVYISLLFLGIWSQEHTGKAAAVLRWCVTGAACVFMAASAAVYGAVLFI
ncbi:MAG: glycosyltransferase family 39 protein [Oscillospiraceae bacterium]|nr:glycosyltransferase family 39 protein [Oscillospiraceae bacterium]